MGLPNVKQQVDAGDCDRTREFKKRQRARGGRDGAQATHAERKEIGKALPPADAGLRAGTLSRRSGWLVVFIEEVEFISQWWQDLTLSHSSKSRNFVATTGGRGFD